MEKDYEYIKVCKFKQTTLDNRYDFIIKIFRFKK